MRTRPLGLSVITGPIRLVVSIEAGDGEAFGIQVYVLTIFYSFVFACVHPLEPHYTTSIEIDGVSQRNHLMLEKSMGSPL